MAEQQNLVYEQINWGWLNDYAGYKFAPITFYEQLYTSDGRSFKNMFNDTLDDLRDGTFVVGASQRLVQQNNDGTYSKYTPGMNLPNGEASAYSEFKPIYFLDGKPSVNPYLNINSNGHINISHKQDEYGIYQPALRHNDAGPITDRWNNTILPVEGYQNYFIYGGHIYGNEFISRDENSKDTNNQETNYTYIKFGDIKATNKIDVPTINSTIVNSNIKFTNPITITLNGAVEETSISITESNKIFTKSLTLIDSGVTAGIYGPTADTNTTTLTSGGAFQVPKLQVNAKGLVTRIDTYTFTLPSTIENANKIKIKTIDTLTDSSTYYLVSTDSSGDGKELSIRTDIYITKEEGTDNGVIMGAAWNDYAEYRRQIQKIEPGYCVISNDKGEINKTNQHLSPCDGIVSDTFGFAIGKTDIYQTPLAVAGRVLAYCEGDRHNYHAGDVVCASKNGKVIKMTREEIREYPDRIVGTVSEIPNYEYWNNKLVNDRIWIKVK